MGTAKVGDQWTQTVPSRRALIVDDEFLIAFDLESSMRELGFDVCTVASNERDAIELAKSNLPDVVVMDVYLGGTRTGIETGRWLREVCGVPVVFVTAHSDAETLERIHSRCAHCACAVQAGLSTNAGRRGDGGYTLKAWYRGTA